jgi:glutathione S-transferase
MTIEIAAFRWVPPFAQGYVRDLWVRWALEEAGLSYETVLIDPPAQSSERYRAWQPFGKVPAYRDGTVTMFESGAIVLHLASKSDALAPRGEAEWARVASWVLAALNTIDPHIGTVFAFGDGPELQTHRAKAEAALTERLASLSAWLGDKDYLEGRFTAGDLMMTGVIRVLVDSGLLARFPNLDRFRQRCEARPAFARALAAQMEVFRDNTPAG